MKQLRTLVTCISLLAFLAGSPAMAAFAMAGTAVSEAAAQGLTPDHDAPCHGTDTPPGADASNHCAMFENGQCQCAAALALPSSGLHRSPGPLPGRVQADISAAPMPPQPERLLRPPSA